MLSLHWRPTLPATRFGAASTSLSTFQSIAKLGIENLSYLQDENGMLVINEENIQKVIAARTQQMAIETALSYVQQLRQTQENGEITTLANLTLATQVTTQSTWDLVYNRHTEHNWQLWKL